MFDTHLTDEIQRVSLSMFRKNFFGVYHGSVSARLGIDSFLINTKEAIFDEITEDSLLKIESSKMDYRWSMASMDAHIHSEIYRQIPHAKYITYTMPPYVTAYTMSHDKFEAEDYFGETLLGEMDIYDPRQFSDWYERAPYEVSAFFKSNSSHVMLIKGYGIYSYDRDLSDIAKRISVLENSARLLALKDS